jgi:rhodanese-related sulfurtransferase
MRFKVIAVFVMALIMGAVFLLAGSDASAQVPRMSKEELKAMLGKPDVIIIDVRQPVDLAKSTMMIKGAVREDPKQEVKSWVDKYPKDKTIVLYCA